LLYRFKKELKTMKKLILAILLILQPLCLFSQNPEGDSISFRRGKWMTIQRRYPLRNIPRHGIINGLRHRDSLRVLQGYYLRGHNDGPPGWSSIGPTPAHYDGYSVSGRCDFVKYDPENPNIVYLGTAGGGLWKSIDWGNTWMPLTDDLKSLSSGAIAIDEVNNIIYYGTGESCGFTYAYYGYGLYKSTDGGLTFQMAGQGLPYPCYFSAIAVKPNERNVLLAAILTNYANPTYEAGVYRSEDYGETWTRVVPSPMSANGLSCTDLAFSPDGSKAYIVGGQDAQSPNPWENGVAYRISYDGGQTFQLKNKSVYLEGNSRISICESNPNIIYVITCHTIPCEPEGSELWVHVYKSVDGGETFGNPIWQRQVCPCPGGYCDQYNYQPWYNLLIKVHPDNPDIVYWGTTSLWRSLNGGSTVDFIAGYGTSVHPDFHDLDFYPNDQNKIIIACDGGVYGSHNQGGYWANLNSTLTVTQFYSVSADPQNPDNVLGGTQDNGCQRKYSNFSHEWSSIVGGDFGTVSFNPLNSNYVLGKICNSNSLMLSTNNGQYFSFSTPIDFTTWLMPIVWHPTTENIAYTGGKNPNLPPPNNVPCILRSTDYGMSWWKHSVNFPENEVVEKIAISKSNTDIMFASTGSYAFWWSEWSHQKLYKSTNGGVNWIDLQIMEPPNPKIPERYISSIAVNPADENDVFITLSGFYAGHVWRSQDGGNNWRDILSNLPEVPANDIVIYNELGSILPNCIVATDVGVFISTNQGDSWLEVAEGLPNSIALDLELNMPILKTATHGRGVWEVSLSAAGQNFKVATNKYKKFYLYNNDPNPFNPKTKIRFELPMSIKVTVKIYDIIGREVVVLINNEIRNEGMNIVEWNATNYASGVYFYRLIAGSFIDTKKMVLVK
jgi:Secretion system C-terminal sorting domain